MYNFRTTSNPASPPIIVCGERSSLGQEVINHHTNFDLDNQSQSNKYLFMKKQQSTNIKAWI